MGGQHKRQRQYFYICSSCLILFLISGCALFRAGLDRLNSREYLVRGQQLMAEGDYEGAAEENEKALSRAGKDSPGDEALFNLGLINAHYGNPGRDYTRAAEYFQRIIDEYPQSALSERAQIWLGVLSEMEQLKKDELVVTNGRILHIRQLLSQGSFREALKEAQAVLNQSPGNPYADRALFYAGLIYAHYGNPEKDYKKAVSYLEQLVKDYPRSYLYEQARIIIGILNVIEKAKQVDIEIDQKRKELTK